MKRIVLSITTLAFVGALVAGGTYAVWSDSKTIEGNTVSTGSVDIELTEANDEDEIDAEKLKPLVGEGLFPGETTERFYQGIKNNSTRAVNLYIYTERQKNENDVCDETDLTIYTQRNEGGVEEGKFKIGTWSVSELAGENNKKKLTNKDFEEEIAFRNLPVGWVLNLVQEGTLNEDAENKHQDSECEFNEVIVAEPIGENEEEEEHWDQE